MTIIGVPKLRIDGMDDAHVGVAHGSRRPGLVQKGPRGHRTTEPEDLQGHFPVEREVAGAEHGAERSSA